MVSNAIKTVTDENYAHVSFLLKQKNADVNKADMNEMTPLDHLMRITVEQLISDETRE